MYAWNCMFLRNDKKSSNHLARGSSPAVRFHYPFARETSDTLRATSSVFPLPSSFPPSPLLLHLAIFSLASFLFVSQVFASLDARKREPFEIRSSSVRGRPADRYPRRGARCRSFKGRLGRNKDGSRSAADWLSFSAAEFRQVDICQPISRDEPLSYTIIGLKLFVHGSSASLWWKCSQLSAIPHL